MNTNPSPFATTAPTSTTATTSLQKEPDGHYSFGSVYIGKKISDTLFAEPVASRRHMIRSIKADPTFPKRVGEVNGGDREFQAVRTWGDHVAIERSLLNAARTLEDLAVAEAAAR